MKRTVLAPLVLLAVLALTKPAPAQSVWPAGQLASSDLEAAEFVMLDARGSRIVGHGQVKRGVLRLTVGRDVGDFVLLVALADGEVVRFEGRQWLGDSFRIALDDGSQVALDELVTDLGLRLRLERLDPDAPRSGRGAPGDEDDDDDRDDDQDEDQDYDDPDDDDDDRDDDGDDDEDDPDDDNDDDADDDDDDDGDDDDDDDDD